MLDQLHIRDERSEDADAVHALLKAAFGPDDPAVPPLVDSLRRNNRLSVALVAEAGGVLIAFAAASEAWAQHGEADIAAIAPVAVVPAFQRKGIGTRLMREVLDRCRRAGFEAAVVLGDPAFYSRVGFTPATEAHLHCGWCDGPAFQAIALQPGALERIDGLVEYDPCFDECN
ncbi:MAG: N-acetyltransferase [Phycisphaerales bacterium]|nr:N-acetyltransferase [Phycisphaerales bacterium]